MVDLVTLEKMIDQGATRSERLKFAGQVSELCLATRAKHSINQRDLANMLECRQATVSRWELGLSVPDFYVMRKLIGLFKTDDLDVKRVRRWKRAKTESSKEDINLRDRFAMAALSAIIQNKGIQTTGVAAQTAYQVADAMMEARAALGEGKE
jgi:transcriptional regulator with XRE-family HTH domain